MPHQIADIEIFGAGTWTPASGGEVTITEADLDNMVTSFQVTRNLPGFRPRLKLGHQESNEFFGGDKGLPNFGFVSDIKRVGDKILASFQDVPKALFDLMSAGRYNTVSVEVIPRAEVSGSNLFSVLTAVAVLGAELPAVKGLAELADVMLAEDEPGDLISLEGRIMLAKQTDEDQIMSKDNTVTYTQEQHDAVLAKAVADAIAATKADFAAEKTELETRVDKSEGRAKEAREALIALSDGYQAERLTNAIDKAIEDGRATPAQKPYLMTMGKQMATSTDEFSAGDGKDPVKGIAAFEAYLGDLPKAVELDTETGKASDEKPGKFATAEDEILNRVDKLQTADPKLEYRAALSTVLAAASQDLKNRYAAGE